MMLFLKNPKLKKKRKRNKHILTKSDVFLGISQTKFISCINPAIVRSIHQGRGLKFCCKDFMSEVNKIVSYMAFCFAFAGLHPMGITENDTLE